MKISTLKLSYLTCLLFALLPQMVFAQKKTTVIVWQPSHQTDTGVDFNEAQTCNTMVEAAMKKSPLKNEHKVWSLNQPNLHHANQGSNTLLAHTSDTVNNQISGYAFEINKSNGLNADVFISFHNNGGTKQHAIWGFIHESDEYEQENRELAARLTAAIASVTDLTNKGVFGDSWPNRNDYRCKTTGKRAFYSLDENVNKAKYRVLLEVGDMGQSREFLSNPENLKKMGEAVKVALLAWLKEKGL
jgi:hypothetical protein